MERGNYRIGSFVCENPSLDFAGVEGIVMSRNGWNTIWSITEKNSSEKID